MKLSWRYIKSFFREEVVEVGQSEFSPGLQVWYAYGRMMLNTANVNYSFGRLDKVFRSTFKQLHIQDRNLREVLLLGLGAGNVPRILAEYDPKIKVVTVEIDPEVLRLGEAHFDLRQGPQLEIVLADALLYVEECKRQFDLVVVDLFVDATVPAQACSESFLQKLAALLRPQGILVFNRLAHSEELSQQTEAFGRKMIAALPGTFAMKADLNKVWVYEKK
jgi:spermidine synthase